MSEAIVQTADSQAQGKSMVVGYILWFFLGYLGVHRFYLGKIGTGVTQLALFIVGVVTAFFLVGFLFFVVLGIWWLCDAYFVQAIVTRYNREHGLSDPVLAMVNNSKPGDDLDALEKLHSLREKGVLTEEEYQARKAKFV